MVTTLYKTETGLFDIERTSEEALWILGFNFASVAQLLYYRN